MTIYFYAYSNIPKSLEICNEIFNIQSVCFFVHDKRQNYSME